MNKEILEKIIETRSVSFSYEEIQSLLDEELEKSPDEMDAELVDMCIEALENAEKKPPETPARKKLGAKKIILIAAIVVIMAVLALPVGAKVFKIEAAENAVEVFEDFIRIHFSKDKLSPMQRELSAKGIDNAFLPNAFYSEDCSVASREVPEDNTYIIDFSLKEKGLSGYISISTYDEIHDASMASSDVYLDAEIIKQMLVAGTEIFICTEADEKTVVMYERNFVKYDIVFDNTIYEDVIKIFENF